MREGKEMRSSKLKKVSSKPPKGVPDVGTIRAAAGPCFALEGERFEHVIIKLSLWGYFGSS